MVLAVFKLYDSRTGQGPRALLQSVTPWLGALPTPLVDICVEQHDSSTGAQIHIVLIQHVTGKMNGVFEKPSKYFKKYIYLYKFHHLPIFYCWYLVLIGKDHAVICAQLLILFLTFSYLL